MREPDYDFWRGERARILSGPFNQYREVITPREHLAAIDAILEMEELIKFLRGNLLRVETIVEEFLSK